MMAQPTILAKLHDGPLNGTRVVVDSLEGRPPMTLDLPSDDGGAACRYCLDGLVQGGDSAIYTFLYRVD
jgi:hypothetical protein